jgi:hypothetical protein
MPREFSMIILNTFERMSYKLTYITLAAMVLYAAWKSLRSCITTLNRADTCPFHIE